jgi:hypothetical protein
MGVDVDGTNALLARTTRFATVHPVSGTPAPSPMNPSAMLAMAAAAEARLPNIERIVRS